MGRLGFNTLLIAVMAFLPASAAWGWGESGASDPGNYAGSEHQDRSPDADGAKDEKPADDEGHVAPGNSPASDPSNPGTEAPNQAGAVGNTGLGPKVPHATATRTETETKTETESEKNPVLTPQQLKEKLSAPKQPDDAKKYYSYVLRPKESLLDIVYSLDLKEPDAFEKLRKLNPGLFDEKGERIDFRCCLWIPREWISGPAAEPAPQPSASPAPVPQECPKPEPSQAPAPPPPPSKLRLYGDHFTDVTPHARLLRYDARDAAARIDAPITRAVALGTDVVWGQEWTTGLEMLARFGFTQLTSVQAQGETLSSASSSMLGAGLGFGQNFEKALRLGFDLGMDQRGFMHRGTAGDLRFQTAWIPKIEIQASYRRTIFEFTEWGLDLAYGILLPTSTDDFRVRQGNEKSATLRIDHSLNHKFSYGLGLHVANAGQNTDRLDQSLWDAGVRVLLRWRWDK